MSFSLQPVRVGTGCDEDGMLVFDANERLVAVLVLLSEQYKDLGVAGQWFLEVGFGPVGEKENPVFADLGKAQEWIAQRLQKLPA